MRLACVTLLLLLFPIFAGAQSRGFFFQAGPLVDRRLAASAASYPTLNTSWGTSDFNGNGRVDPDERDRQLFSLGTTDSGRVTSSRQVAAGGRATIGVFVTPTVSLRVEGSMQAAQVQSASSADAFERTAVDTVKSVSTTDLIVSAGWHQGTSRRVSITYLAGMVFRRDREREMLLLTYPAVNTLNLPRQASVPMATATQEHGATSYGAGVMVGFDVGLSISRHFAVVPQLHMLAANRDWNLRPALSMRWKP